MGKPHLNGLDSGEETARGKLCGKVHVECGSH